MGGKRVMSASEGRLNEKKGRDAQRTDRGGRVKEKGERNQRGRRLSGGSSFQWRNLQSTDTTLQYIK